MGRVLILVLLISLFGCTKRNPAACCTTEADCDAKGLPIGSECDDGFTCIRNTCIPPTTCQANSDCDEEELPLCNVESSICVGCIADSDCSAGICDPETSACRACAADTDCTSGYCDLGTGNCGANVLAWRYLPDACDASAAVAFSPAAASAVTIDTTNVSECTRIQPQTDGPDICVLHYTSITIPSTATVRIKGSRVVALVADQNVNVAGVLDVGAVFEPGPNILVAGPGGTFATSGTYPDVNVQTPYFGSAGGGGAGFKTTGGHGGHLADMGAPMMDPLNGGAAVDVKTLPNLVAGPAAESRLNGLGTLTVPGGPGGGGMTVISCAGKIAVSGSVHASGGGGSGGQPVKNISGVGRNGGGFGGGAGGNVLFQALEIELTGTFLASGGAGGSGATTTGGGTRGATPRLLEPCSLDTVGTDSAGNGGAGGCDLTAPHNGAARATNTTQATSGGGGGSVGFFRTATLFNAPVVNPTSAKPAFEPNEQILRR